MYLNQIIVKSLLALSSLVILSSAQDSGDGFIFNCKSPGQVALTFDDGPSPENTPNLLNILGTKGIKATFFVLTVNINEANGKAILKQTFDAGHQIALHSSTHANMNTLTEDGVRQEYSKNLDAVKTTIGKTPNYARPPYGNCKTSCSNVMKELGLTVTQWNADSQDWQYVNAVEKQPSMVGNVLNTIAKGNPATNSFITLQHDIHKFSVDNTPKIIDGIAKLGYKFVTVSECMGNSPPAYKEDGVVGVNSTTTQVTAQQTIASVPASSSSLPTAKSTGVPKANSSSGASKSTSATTPTTAADQSSADKVIVSSNIFGISLLIVSIIISFLG